MIKGIKKIVSNFWFVGIVGGLVANFSYDIFKKYGGGFSMDFLYVYLWEKLWPFWIGLGIALIYKFIRILVNIYKSTREPKSPDKKIDNIIGDINDLKKWIGLFSYQDNKGSYSNLKGKIKRYIEEELKKESAERKAVDTQIADTFSEEIAKIKVRIQDIPMKAISDDKLPIK